MARSDFRLLSFRAQRASLFLKIRWGGGFVYFTLSDVGISRNVNIFRLSEPDVGTSEIREAFFIGDRGIFPQEQMVGGEYVARF